MLTASQFCFAFSLAVFQCQTQAWHDKVFNESEGFGNVTKCSWNCKVTESDLSETLNTDFGKTGVIKVAVLKSMNVKEKLCANQTSLNSSRDTTEKLQLIWRPVNNKPSSEPSSFAHAIETVLNLLLVSSKHEAYREIKVDCNLTVAQTAIANKTSSAPISAIRGHLADLGVDVQGENISNSTDSQLERSNEWLDDATIKFFALVFAIAFVYYSPAILCLFCPTVVTENGIRHISLEGTSPVGLRSLIGNYFYPEIDNLCQRTKTFLARVVLMPLPFLVPAIGFDYVIFQHPRPDNSATQHNIHIFRAMFDLSQPFLLACFTCYVVLAVYDSFFNVSPTETPCLACHIIKANSICNDINLSQRILNHLRLQPLISVKIFGLFCKCLVSYFRISRVILPSLKASTRWLVRVPMFIVFLLTIPVAAVTLFVAMVVVVSFCTVCVTSPIMTLFRATRVNILSGFLLSNFSVLALARIILIILAIIGTCCVLVKSAFGFVIAIAVVFVLLLSGKGLPFLVCFVLVCYYLWSSYSSFTYKYHDFSLVLFKFYKQSQQQVNISEELHTDFKKSNTQDGYEVRIPEGLFNMACEELMPIRESVCIVLLKVTLILSFVSLTFLLIMRYDVGSTPTMQALATFFTGAVPKIIAIYFDGDKTKRVEATLVEEKVPKILQDYLNGTQLANEMVASEENSLIDDQM